MKIVTLLKHVPDSMANIRPSADETGIETAGVKFGPNPFDEFAVEAAVQIREGGAEVEIVALCLGPAGATESLRPALAMGADRAVHLCDDAFEGQDALATARCLAKAIADEDGVDLVLAGEHAIDDGQSMVPSMLAELLDWQQANGVTELAVSGDSPVQVSATRRIEGGEEKLALTGPAVVSCEKGLNDPRYPSLPNLMKAKKKEIKTVSAADLGIDANLVGRANSSVRVTRVLEAKRDRRRHMVAGETPEAQAAELARLLHEEAGVI